MVGRLHITSWMMLCSIVDFEQVSVCWYTFGFTLRFLGFLDLLKNEYTTLNFHSLTKVCCILLILILFCIFTYISII